MRARNTNQKLEAPRQGGPQFEPGIKELLDHVAAELAAEYVRLMDAAAQAGDPSRMHAV
ncbi:MAG TPA: hypothetical protein VMU39_29465 [Solirubrobacteraceae bacterium]|nr:hypothetical protein [Solirubrobacteraceae bacterium]